MLKAMSKTAIANPLSPRKVILIYWRADTPVHRFAALSLAGEMPRFRVLTEN